MILHAVACPSASCLLSRYFYGLLIPPAADHMNVGYTSLCLLFSVSLFLWLMTAPADLDTLDRDSLSLSLSLSVTPYVFTPWTLTQLYIWSMTS